MYIYNMYIIHIAYEYIYIYTGYLRGKKDNCISQFEFKILTIEGNSNAVSCLLCGSSILSKNVFFVVLYATLYLA